jgi:hypothetical protein
MFSTMDLALFPPHKLVPVTARWQEGVHFCFLRATWPHSSSSNPTMARVLAASNIVYNFNSNDATSWTGRHRSWVLWQSSLWASLPEASVPTCIREKGLRKLIKYSGTSSWKRYRSQNSWRHVGSFDCHFEVLGILIHCFDSRTFWLYIYG